MPFELAEFVNLEAVTQYALYALSCMGAFLAALWLALVIWTFKDMRSRSRDIFAAILAALLVAILNIPALLIYLILRPRETLNEAYERALEEEALLQQIEVRNSCPGCSRPTKDDWHLCPHCMTILKKACVQCDYPLDLTWNVCPRCSTPAPGRGSEVEPETPSSPANIVPSQANNASIIDDTQETPATVQSPNGE